ncbi:ABC transporter [Archangium violaceum]|uniref:ABC transporter n=1 Tax=Archangium violaceum Cb vi76 TaxID=1406225 RepID=A0A084SKN6_9BACT|nr:ABC transporter [Archangium violaceum]KFA89021.1 ABC transporter [Archangium violaceum Cb vi76]
MSPRGSSRPLSLAFAGVLLLGLIAERIAGAGSGLTAVGVVRTALLLGIIARGAMWMVRAEGEREVLWRWVLACYAAGLAGLLLYTAQSELGARLLGVSLAESSPGLAVVFQALFPALLVSSLVPLALLESSLAAMARAPVLETDRARGALFSGVGTASVLVFACSTLYVATQLDTGWDLSYFRTTRPGESTRKVVQALTEPIRATLFFPPASEEGELVAQYFRELAQASPLLQVERLDQAMEPARARAMGVMTNGFLVLSRGEQHEMYTVGLEPERSRAQLARLDQAVHRRLLLVSRPKHVLYLTTGHGERGDARPVPGVPAPPGLGDFKDFLHAHNVVVRSLSVAEGLGNEVPPDAAAVVIPGATQELLPGEVTALRDYLDRGGRLWLALEPDGPAHAGLLAPLGLKFVGTPLANDQAFFRSTRQLSDRANLGTALYSAHPSVATLSSLGPQAPVAFPGAGLLEPELPPPAGVSHDVTVWAHEATFPDMDRDFTQDPGEERRGWPLMVAVQKMGRGQEPARVVVMADVDALADGVLPTMGNAYLALDALRWLTGDESISGTVSNEEDVALRHTREQDVIWFYATVFLAPAMVLGTGFFVTRRRGQRAPRMPEGGGR